MSAFPRVELAFLTGRRRLGRVATVGEDGSHMSSRLVSRITREHDTIDIGGRDLERSKRYRDVRLTGKAAVVVDDLESIEPWCPRGVEVRGRATAVSGERPVIRIRPDRVRSWGLPDADPDGSS